MKSIFWFHGTIQKKDFCSSQKYPKHLNISSSSVLPTKSKYRINFVIEAAYQTLFQFLKILLTISFVYFQNFNFNVAYFRKSRNFDVRCFCFSSSKFCCFDNGWTAVCRAKFHKNEKWLSFGGRCLDTTTTNLIEFRKKFYISTWESMFWVFLCRTKVHFVNRDEFLQWANCCFIPQWGHKFQGKNLYFTFHHEKICINMFNSTHRTNDISKWF